MSEKRTCQEVKIEISKDDEERIRNCIHIYCTVGANRIKELLARIGGKKNNNDTKVNSVSERMERIKEAAPEIYELVKEELIPTSDYGGILSFEREAKIRKVLDYIDSEENGHEKKHD